MDIKSLLKGITDCSCGRSHTCAIDTVDISDGAIDRLGELCDKYGYSHILLVADRNTHTVCGGRVVSALAMRLQQYIIIQTEADKVVIPDEEQIKFIEDSLTHNTDLIIGIGSGVINDLCKYVSFKNNLPYFIVATAPSMDGYASVGSALILSGMKVTLNARPPKAIISEPKVLATAPTPMLQSGYGDIIGKYSCLNDWRLARVIKDEYFCDEVYELTMSCVKEVEPLAEAILARETAAVGALMEALVAVGIAMAYVGNSRPASGSEHHLSHFFEITGILDNKEYFLHGIDVMYSAAVTCKLREMIVERGLSDKKVQRPHRQAETKRVYSSLTDEVLALQEKVGLYAADDSEVIASRASQIRLVLSTCPDFDYINSLLKRIGLDFDDFVKMYGIDKITDAVLYGKDLKDRYTVLWLYYQFGEK